MKLIRIAQSFYVDAKADPLNKWTAMVLKYSITGVIDIETPSAHNYE